MPEIIRPDPRRIIPYHDFNPRRLNYWTQLFLCKEFDSIPPIPVVEAPEDLRVFGDYVNYNGHHRTKSAILAEAIPFAYLIKTDEDIGFLGREGELYEELIGGLDESFKTHYEFVCEQARRYLKLRNLLGNNSLVENSV